MQAVGVIEFGGPEALQFVELPEVHAGPGQVRIRVHGATINPTDTYHRNGSRAEMLRKDPPPYIPGMDCAGVIDEMADDVEGFAIGEPVMAMVIPNGTQGGYRSSIVLDTDQVAHAPAGSTHAEAATLPMNGLTARLSLDQLALSPGQTLAVTGAAGCYGGYVVQLAKADGLRVIADAGPDDVELVRSLGADDVIERGDDIADRIRALVPGGVDGLADGAVQNELAVAAVRDGGAYASVRFWSPPPERDIAFHKTLVSEYDHRADLLEVLGTQVENGLLTLRVAQTYPPEQAPEAHRRLEAGGTRGRLVITFE